MDMIVEKTKVVRISRSPSPEYIMTDQKQPEDVEYFDCSTSMITSEARGTREINSRIGMAKAAISKKKALFTSSLDLNLR
jgi:hypothetical protein